MPLLDDENDSRSAVQTAEKESNFIQLSFNMKTRSLGNKIELYQHGVLVGTYWTPEAFWEGYRKHSWTPGDEIALHGLGVALNPGERLPEPQRETLPWEMHAIS